MALPLGAIIGSVAPTAISWSKKALSWGFKQAKKHAPSLISKFFKKKQQQTQRYSQIQTTQTQSNITKFLPFLAIIPILFLLLKKK